MLLFLRKNLFLILPLIGFGLFNLHSTTLNTSLTKYTPEYAHPKIPVGFNDLFASSVECNLCHGHDFAGIANVTSEGEDVNMMDAWRSTMMANSARDPFWQAKVSHEVSLHPDLQDEIETSCTDCHAPLGFFNAMKNGADTYTLAEMNADPIAMDGVSCLACHQQSPDSLDVGFSGHLHFVDAPIAYGPYESPLVSPMASVSTYVPTYSDHVNDAALCSSCHTLITQTLDDQSNELDNYFIEQATYHEWLNSSFSDENNPTACQQCHMPDLGEEAIQISALYNVNPRSPYYLHDLVGGNVHMLNILKNNSAALGVVATAAQFNKTISKTYNMLQNQGLNMTLTNTGRDIDSVFYQLDIENLAGHRFPSGYPARRLVVEFTVKNPSGDTLFHSGGFDNEFYALNEDSPYEPHHDVITSEDQTQIYEMVMGKENGDFTTILTYAHHPLKDNRLVPNGFSTTHEVYDTTLIAGFALEDNNFNHVDGIEGSGTDQLNFHIPLNGSTDSLIASANIYYQPIPPKWMEEMFEGDTPQINSFHNMYNNADLTPILVASDEEYSGETTSVDEWSIQAPKIYLDKSKQIIIQGNDSYDVEVYDIQGRLLYSDKFINNASISSSKMKGEMIIKTTNSQGKTHLKRMIIIQ